MPPLFFHPALMQVHPEHFSSSCTLGRATKIGENHRLRPRRFLPKINLKSIHQWIFRMGGKKEIYLNLLQTKLFFQVNAVSPCQHRLRNFEFEFFNAWTRNFTVSVWVWVQIWKTAAWGDCTWDIYLIPNPHLVDLRSCRLGVSVDNCEKSHVADESQVRENLVTNRMLGKPRPLFHDRTWKPDPLPVLPSLIYTQRNRTSHQRLVQEIIGKCATASQVCACKWSFHLPTSSFGFTDYSRTRACMAIIRRRMGIPTSPGPQLQEAQVRRKMVG